MLEVLLPKRHCQRCGADIGHLKKSAETCGSICRQKRWERLNPGRRARRGTVPSYNGKSGRRRANSRRQPTRYLVYCKVGEDSLRRVDVVTADRPERAKAKVEQAHGIDREKLRTVPEHNLR
jgi:predicted nucleic acid-binding Zn ribbon protein